MDPFSYDAVKLLQNQYKEPFKKNTKRLIQQTAKSTDTPITDIDDPIENRILKDDKTFQSDFFVKSEYNPE